MTQTTEAQENKPLPLCTHTKSGGDPCRAPALRAHTLCHFHQRFAEGHHAVVAPTAGDDVQCLNHPQNTAEVRRMDPYSAEYYRSIPANQPLILNFPPLEDRDAIQVALSMLINALGHNRLHAKRAAVMLYGLHLATANLKSPPLKP